MNISQEGILSNGYDAFKQLKDMIDKGQPLDEMKPFIQELRDKGKSKGTEYDLSGEKTMLGDHKTLINYAALKGKADVVWCLLEHGADPMTTGESFKNTLAYLLDHYTTGSWSVEDRENFDLIGHIATAFPTSLYKQEWSSSTPNYTVFHRIADYHLQKLFIFLLSKDTNLDYSLFRVRSDNDNTPFDMFAASFRFNRVPYPSEEDLKRMVEEEKVRAIAEQARKEQEATEAPSCFIF